MDNKKSEVKSETVLHTTTNKELANNLRTALLQNFRRLWIFIYNTEGTFTITASSEFCGKLNEELVIRMKNFTSTFLGESAPLQSLEEFSKEPISDPIKDILNLIKF